MPFSDGQILPLDSRRGASRRSFSPDKSWDGMSPMIVAAPWPTTVALKPERPAATPGASLDRPTRAFGLAADGPTIVGSIACSTCCVGCDVFWVPPVAGPGTAWVGKLPG